MSLLEESDALHERVRRFARQSLAGATSESFDVLAADIARFQVAYVPGFRRLVEAHGSALTDAASIPAVPVDAFRLTRVAVHPPELDAVRFLTSGTTSGAQGVHAMRTTDTYRELSLAWGVPSLLCDGGPRVVVALAPDPGPRITSSLAYMMRALMETLDGRSLASESASDFESDAGTRWLVGAEGADVAGLAHAAALASERREPLLVLATSFALAHLVEDCEKRHFQAPDGSVVMTTGGFKGRSREVSPEALVERVGRQFGVPASRIIGEYGMTELTSQLYERAPTRGSFHAPPWLRVTPVDAETLVPVTDGETGIARFVDLGNVDSAVAIVTQDLVRLDGEGVQLLGRRQGAPARGCSLAIEEMVVGGRR